MRYPAFLAGYRVVSFWSEETDWAARSSMAVGFAVNRRKKCKFVEKSEEFPWALNRPFSNGAIDLRKCGCSFARGAIFHPKSSDISNILHSPQKFTARLPLSFCRRALHASAPWDALPSHARSASQSHSQAASSHPKCVNSPILW